MEESKRECANAETVKLLLSLGAEVGAVDELDRSPLFIAARSGCRDTFLALVSSGGVPARELLYSSVCIGDLEMLEKLVETGYASINTTFAGGMTMLHQAAIDGYPHVAKWLVRHAPELVDAKTPDLEERPLSFAAENGHEEVVRVLLENGADVNCRDRRGWTPLRWASLYSHQGVMKMLKDAGGRV